MSRPRKTLAIHEAGHAVAAVCLDINFKYVTIIPGGVPSDVLESDAEGHIKLKPVPRYARDPATQDNVKSLHWWERRLIVCLAGPAAHHKLHPYAHWMGYAVGDIGEASDTINHIHHHDRRVVGAHYDYIKARAAALIEDEWQNVEAVAAALIERGTLTPDDVRRAMANLIPAKAGVWSGPPQCP
jgi:hypothetical protein